MVSNDEVCKTCVEMGCDKYRDGSGIDICLCDQCPYNDDDPEEGEKEER